MFGIKNKRVYLDWAAATPLDKEVFLAMKPFLLDNYGNPSAIHQEGLVARRAIDKAREQVASVLQVRPELVTFTSGGTEANNLAMVGAIEALKLTGRAYSDMEIITTPIEHPSVSHTLEHLQELGVKIKKVAVSETGQVVLNDLRELLSDKTVLVSVAYANSEIGTIQSTRAIRKIIREAEEKFGTKIYFHVDAAQAPLWLSCQFDSVGADLLTLDVLKCGGPKGVGILVKNRRVELLSVMSGGGQENGLRPGTENVAGIVGAGVALKLAQSNWRTRAEKVSKMRDEGTSILLETLPEAILNGAIGEERLANNINISIPKLDTEYLVVVLDKAGFAVSTKSACAGAGGGESAVVKAISGDPVRASATLRISIGPDTIVSQLKELAVVIKSHTEMMKNIK